MLCTLWKQRSFCWFKVRQVPSILISSWLVQKVPPRFKLVYYSYIRLHSLQFPQTYTCADFPSFAAASPWDMSLPPQHPPHLGPVSTPKISRSRISWGWQNVLSSPHCFTPLSGMPLNSILHISLRKKNTVILLSVLLHNMILFQALSTLIFSNPVLTLWLLPSTWGMSL